MKDLDTSLDINKILRKSYKKPRVYKPLTKEQWYPRKARYLINKIKTGDLDLNDQSHKRLFYWGLKEEIVDRDFNILKHF